ncbi:MAG: hypothetical protein IPG47_17650 [Thermoflexaceae bacterium]|nr:hypothetical protein [Thermoflexaceae bacterium]
MTAPDRVPERTHFRDTGCDVAPACLRCPLPVCRYDVPARQVLRASDRRERIREMTLAGLSSVQIAAVLGISVRSVFRIRREMNA